MIKDTGTDECILDNIYDNGTYIGAISSSGSEMICYLLNNFHEENQQLKQELKNGICPLCGARVSKCGGLK